MVRMLEARTNGGRWSKGILHFCMIHLCLGDTRLRELQGLGGWDQAGGRAVSRGRPAAVARPPRTPTLHVHDMTTAAVATREAGQAQDGGRGGGVRVYSQAERRRRQFRQDRQTAAVGDDRTMGWRDTNRRPIFWRASGGEGSGR